MSLPSPFMRVACVCEDKTLNFYNLEGERVSNHIFHPSSLFTGATLFILLYNFLIILALFIMQTAVLDVSGLDGRPRDMWSCKLDLTDGNCDTNLQFRSFSFV